MCAEFISPIPVVACAVECKGHLLLLKRAIEPGIGKWAFPAGHLEPGETAEQGMERELKEETDLSLRVTYLRSYSKTLENGLAYISLIFKALSDTERVTIDEESSDWLWVPLKASEIAQLEFAFPNHRQVALEFAERLSVCP